MDDYLQVNRANWDERAPAHGDNEITHGGFDLTQPTPCTNQRVSSGHVPVCVSFKPGQSEHVWADKLTWRPSAASCPKGALSRTGRR